MRMVDKYLPFEQRDLDAYNKFCKDLHKTYKSEWSDRAYRLEKDLINLKNRKKKGQNVDKEIKDVLEKLKPLRKKKAEIRAENRKITSKYERLCGYNARNILEMKLE